MATLGKRLVPLLAVLALALAGCGDVRTCLGSCGGQSEPPFTATLSPTYLLAWRGETMAGPLVVDIYSEYPVPFTVSVCLRRWDNSPAPSGIYLTGTDPDNPWSCLVGDIERTARYVLPIGVRRDVPLGVYHLRLQVANRAFVRNLDFTLEVH
jgi:hypothetical protein